METTVELNIWCVGHVTFERSGYYAGAAIVNDFKVFIGNNNITALLSVEQVSALKKEYAQHCLEELEEVV